MQAGLAAFLRENDEESIRGLVRIGPIRISNIIDIKKILSIPIPNQGTGKQSDTWKSLDRFIIFWSFSGFISLAGLTITTLPFAAMWVTCKRDDISIFRGEQYFKQWKEVISWGSVVFAIKLTSTEGHFLEYGCVLNEIQMSLLQTHFGFKF